MALDKKANGSVNLINYEPDTDEIRLKINIYLQISISSKYQYLMIKFNKRIKYSSDMDDICKNIDEYKPERKQKKF